RGTPEHRVPDSRGDLLRVADSKRLGDEERVAAAFPVQLLRVYPARPRQPGDRIERERLQPYPRGPSVGGELAEHLAKRMKRPELRVAVARQHDGLDALHPASEQPQD